MEWRFIDGSIVKAHQHSACAADGGEQGIGKSRGGLTTKIHMAVDAFSFPVCFKITGGEVHDSQIAPALVDKMPHLRPTTWLAIKVHSTPVRSAARTMVSRITLGQASASTQIFIIYSFSASFASS